MRHGDDGGVGRGLSGTGSGEHDAKPRVSSGYADLGQTAERNGFQPCVGTQHVGHRDIQLGSGCHGARHCTG